MIDLVNYINSRAKENCFFTKLMFVRAIKSFIENHDELGNSMYGKDDDDDNDDHGHNNHGLSGRRGHDSHRHGGRSRRDDNRGHRSSRA